MGKKSVLLFIISMGLFVSGFMFWSAQKARKKSNNILEEFRKVNSSIDSLNKSVQLKDDSLHKMTGALTTQNQITEQPVISYHNVYASDHSKNCKCKIEYELKDSMKLTHIKDQFYKSETGHLYEKTWSQRQIKGQDTLSWVLYFNGLMAQEIDPFTFTALDGWYAKDKNYVYYYRPESGGMRVSKIDAADTKTFKLLAGHYKYAQDAKYFYDEPTIISGFTPNQTTLKIDKRGRVSEMICKGKIYKFELVN